MDYRSDNKRLAKNTLVLYFRTFVMMLIGFYTSRLILNTLGIENYGIKNAVGGFISLFMIVRGTLTATTSRYLTCEIGKVGISHPHKIFSVAVVIHVLLALLLFLLLETLGLYFLNHGLNIPPDRMYAANWVFQFSVLSTILDVLNAPYISAIIAHEKMSAFAFFSMFDVIAKLLIVYLLYITPYDRLITYSFFFFCVGLINRIIYNLYCKKNFEETRKVRIVRDKGLYKEMFGFAGINFIGGVASLLSVQGTNILLNLFYGVTLNAAVGISNQVRGISTKFVGDFVTAIKPQITKEYAAGNPYRSMNLAFRGAKFSYFLTLILACPIMARTEYILEFWLKIFPPEAVVFSQLAIILTMLVMLSDPLVTVILATGKIKSVSLWIGGVRLLILPLEYIALMVWGIAYLAIVVQIAIEIISLFIRLVVLNNITGTNYIAEFSKSVLLPIGKVTFLSCFIAYICRRFFIETFWGLCGLSAVTIGCTCLGILYIGLSANERIKVLSVAHNKIGNIIRPKY